LFAINGRKKERQKERKKEIKAENYIANGRDHKFMKRA